MKSALIAAAISFLMGGASAGTAVKFYADHTYELKLEAAEKYLAMDNSIKQTASQQRIWVLQDRIAQIRRTAERNDRPLTTADKNDIRELETQINNLKGW
jgi:hypothetical protein